MPDSQDDAFVYPFSTDGEPITGTVTFSPGFWDVFRVAAVAFGTATEEQAMAMSDDDIALAMMGGEVDTSTTTPWQLRRQRMAAADDEGDG